VTRFGPRPVRAARAPAAAVRAFSEGQAMESEYRPVIDFWFRELVPQQWFADVPRALDELVRTRFDGLVEAARCGALDHWASSPRGRLALILLLDQAPRHAFRGTREAFAGDTKAQALAAEGIEARMDEPLTFAERLFFYMPLMHAEDRDLQALSLERFDSLRDAAEAVLGFASGRRTIVNRFGRFPHRNRILGRESSPEEEVFLASDATVLS
jgi:uncharacterized protein (DUF924 family)